MDGNLSNRKNQDNVYNLRKCTSLSTIESIDVELIEEDTNDNDEKNLDVAEKPSLMPIQAAVVTNKSPKDLLQDRKFSKTIDDIYENILSEIKGRLFTVEEIKYKMEILKRKSGNPDEIQKQEYALSKEKMKINDLENKALTLHKKHPNHKWKALPHCNDSDDHSVEEIDLDGIEDDEEKSLSSQSNGRDNSSDVSFNEDHFDQKNEDISDQNESSMKSESFSHNFLQSVYQKLPNGVIKDLSEVATKKFNSQIFKFQKELESRGKIIESLEGKYHTLNDELKRMRKDQKELNLRANDLKSFEAASQGMFPTHHKSYSNSKLSSSEVKKLKTKQSCSTSHLNSYSSKDKENARSAKKTESLDNQNENGAVPSDTKEEKLKRVYEAMRSIFDSPRKQQPQKMVLSSNLQGNTLFRVQELQTSLDEMKRQHGEYRDTIKLQQSQLDDYHQKYLASQNQIKKQIKEIEYLQSKNKELENEIDATIVQMKEKFEEKFREYSHLPHMIKSEKAKLDRVTREKSALSATIRSLKHECSILKQKFEDIAKKRSTSNMKIKNTERDLKIFKNQNAILKDERRRLKDELSVAKDQLKSINTNNGKVLARTKEKSDAQKKSLQRKISQLENEVVQIRCQSSTVIEQRDKLISELQKQLNTLAKNFETSQKQLRTLRRHIFSITGNTHIPERLLIGDTGSNVL